MSLGNWHDIIVFTSNSHMDTGGDQIRIHLKEYWLCWIEFNCNYDIILYYLQSLNVFCATNVKKAEHTNFFMPTFFFKL